MALLEFLLAKIILDESRKNWKVIGYFNDQKASENTVEISLKKKDLVKIWMITERKKIEYARYQVSNNESERDLVREVQAKLEEIEEIFAETSNEMEWEKINIDS
uniref:Uncharacterized protein n=1 Tax=Rhizophagus irregularis (strain DAOM 181602 / DAOM 197198 / MUCL 43194) TaxID=747089 RepID=U9ULV9_RHIID